MANLLAAFKGNFKDFHAIRRKWLASTYGETSKLIDQNIATHEILAGQMFNESSDFREAMSKRDENEF